MGRGFEVGRIEDVKVMNWRKSLPKKMINAYLGVTFSGNKKTKCPIDAHCHSHCRRDPRISNDCIELEVIFDMDATESLCNEWFFTHKIHTVWRKKQKRGWEKRWGKKVEATLLVKGRREQLNEMAERFFTLCVYFVCEWPFIWELLVLQMLYCCIHVHPCQIWTDKKVKVCHGKETKSLW